MLLVDPRVGSKDLLVPLQRYGVLAEMSPTDLDAADFAFIGRGPNATDVYVGVELKETRDLIGCLFDGRFTAEQIPKLQNTYSRVWLLTEGIWRAGTDGILERFQSGDWHPVSVGRKSIMAADLDAWILSQTLMGGFQHHHCATRTDTIRWLATLYHWWTNKAFEEHRSHRAIYIAPPDRVLMTPPSPFLKMMSCIPSVGWDKGVAIEAACMAPGQTFGSIHHLVNATEHDLRKIPGIGPVLASRIRFTLNGRS